MFKIAACFFLGLGLTACGGGDDAAGAGGTGGAGGGSGGAAGAAGAAGASACGEPDTTLPLTITASRTLTRACSPYTMATRVDVDGAATTLTIESGVEIIVTGDYPFVVDGGARLDAQGAATAPVVFHADAATAVDGWSGIGLHAATAAHRLEHVTVRDAGNTNGALGDMPTAVFVGDATEALFNGVRVESSHSNGLRLFRETAALADGSSFAVDASALYPVVADVQNAGSLPGDLALSSADPDKSRILVFGGTAGVVATNVTWKRQLVPFEVAVSFTLQPGVTWTIAPPAVVSLRTVSVSAQGTLVAEGTTTDKIRFEGAPGYSWSSLVLYTADSHLNNVELSGGGTPAEGMIELLLPKPPSGCVTGPVIENTTFASPGANAGGYCLSHHAVVSNDYSASNQLTGCTLEPPCS